MPRALAIAVPGTPGRVCEDAADVHPDGDAVALADGLGSAALGSLGSYSAVQLALGPVRMAALSGHLDLGERLRDAFFAWTEGDHRIASTCLFAIVGPNQVTLGQVGDGVAGVLYRDGTWEQLPPSSKDFGNETVALPRGIARCRRWPRHALRGLLLATDGVADDLLPEVLPRLAATLCRQLLEEGVVPTEEKLKIWLENWRTPNSNDDRSIALMAWEDP